MNPTGLLSSSELLNILSAAHIAAAIYAGDPLRIEAATDEMLAIWKKDRSIVGTLPENPAPELKSAGLTGITVKKSEDQFDHEYRALRNTDGKIYGLLHTATESPQPSNAATVHQLKAMVMNTPVAMAVLKGHELVVELANEPMLAVWRRSLDQVIGRGLVEVFPELKDQPNPGRMRGVMQSGQRFTLPETEVILGTLEGALKKHYASFSYDPIFEPDGTVNSILVTVVNITEEVLNRQQLEQSREEMTAVNEELRATNEKLTNVTHDFEETNLRLNMAIDASLLGTTEVVFATGQMTASDQFKKNYGRRPDEDFTYTQLFEAMLPQYRDGIKAKVKAAIDNHTIYEAEYEIEWPDGSRHWISAHGKPRYDEHGIATRIVGVTGLITEQKNLEQQKDDFLSVASHELKTPITALKANLQLLQRMKDKLDNPIIPKLIDTANKGMDRINGLVDDLLNINRFSQGNLELQRSEFKVGAMLESASTALRAENKYELAINGDQSLILLADEHRVEQVVVNFLNNAAKYAPNSRIINMKYELVNNDIKISVTDQGPGIPSAQLPHLFNRYWRADHGGKKYSGLGLGLFICAEIIQRHGGTIGADSVLGEGSTFWFTIPQAAV